MNLLLLCIEDVLDSKYHSVEIDIIKKICGFIIVSIKNSDLK